jgi:hypothetical protein
LPDTVKFFFAWRLPYNAKLKLSIIDKMYGELSRNFLKFLQTFPCYKAIGKSLPQPLCKKLKMFLGLLAKASDPQDPTFFPV